MGLKNAGRALAHRNYRLFLAGQGVSLVGTWMQQLGLQWLVWNLTRNLGWVGAVAFCGQIPVFFTAPVAGVMADRWNRHRALIVSQSLAMIQAGLLVALTVYGHIQIWQILALSVMLGLINAFDIPLRQSFLVEMVTRREDVPNAIALNSSMVNIAQLIGPAIGGGIIAVWGEKLCFELNALSYLAVLVALLMMRDLPTRQRRVHPKVWHGLKEGIRYAYGFPPIRSLLWLLCLVSLAASPQSVLMPVFASDVLNGGAPRTAEASSVRASLSPALPKQASTADDSAARLFGYLRAAPAIGAFGAAIYLAARKHVLGLARLMTLATCVMGLGMIAFSKSTTPWISLSILPVIGFCMMFQMAVTNTLLQTLVDEDKRGRVMSLYTTAFVGAAPFGSLLAGWLANRFGAPLVVRLGGLVCLGGALLFATNLPRFRQQLRTVYRKTGILPPVSAALQVSSELMTPPEEAG